MFRFFCPLFFVSILITFALGFNMLGPADIVFHSFTTCDPPHKTIQFGIAQRKYNRTTNVLDLLLDSPYDLGEDIVIEMKGSLKKEGGYKPGALYMKDKVCSLLDVILGDIFKDVLKANGRDSCPLPAGKYSVKDFYVDNKKFNVPQVYGEYKMDVIVFHKDEIKGCFICYFEFVPKAY